MSGIQWEGNRIIVAGKKGGTWHTESVQFTMFHRSNKAVLIPYLIKAFLFAFNLEKKKTYFKYLSAA